MKTADDRHFRVEREEREKEESFPPHPLYKEQNENRREFFYFAARRESFRQECLRYVGKFNEERLADFYYYWSETDRQGRMRFERQKYWDLESRLHRWMKNKYSSDNTAAALRLEKAKKGKMKEQDTAKQQQAAAVARSEDNERLFQAIEENKRNAVSYEKYLEQKQLSDENKE